MAEGVVCIKGNVVQYTPGKEDTKDDTGDKESDHELEDETITVDEIVEQLGCGPFQVFITFFSGFLWVAHAIELMVLAVLSPAIKSQWDISASEGALLTSMVFVGTLLGALLFGPFCDRYGRRTTTLVAYVGVFIFGVLTAVPVSQSKDVGYTWLLVMRMGVGLMSGGTLHLITHYVEFIPKKARGAGVIVLDVFWAAGSMLGALLALATLPYLDWHWYLGLSAVPMGLVLLMFTCIPESARFYVVKNKPKKAEKVIKFIAWFSCKTVPQGRIVAFENRLIVDADHVQTELNTPAYHDPDESEDEDFQPEELLLPGDVQSHQSIQEVDEDGSEMELRVHNTTRNSPLHKMWTILKRGVDTYKPLFTHRVWRTTLPLAVIWFGCGWLYYGIVLLTTTLLQYDAHCGFAVDNSSNSSAYRPLTTSDYLKITWSAAAEIPGVILTLVIIDQLGRKKTMAVQFFALGGGILLLFICTSSTVLTVFLFILRGLIAGVYMAVYVYTPEVYPTSIRAGALGLHYIASKIGAILCPFAAEVLIHKSDYLTISLYAASAFVATLMAVILPIETTGRPLKDREQ